MGLFSALHTSARSLQVFTAGISVAGQNIANATTPGYIREELNLETAPPYRRGHLLIGTGVEAAGIRQQINVFLETRIHTASADTAAAKATSEIFIQLEAALNELGENDLSTALSDFVGAVHDLVNEPDNVPLRQRVIQQGTELARDITDLRTRVDELRQGQDLRVEDLVREANELINEIDSLNPRIVKLEAGGLLQSDAGGLRTQRYNAMQRLAEILPGIRFRERETGAVDLFMGSDWLLLDGSKQNLELYAEPNRDLSVGMVRTTRTGSPLPEGGGELRGVIDGRDRVLGGFVDDLNSFAANLISEFNRLHASGEGRVGYTSITAEHGISDTSATLTAAGLPFAVRHGGFDLKVLDQSTGQVTTSRIAVDLDGLNGDDANLASLAASLDALPNVTASIDAAGRLNLAAAEGYEIRFGDDTSGVLAALGVNNFFTGTDSGSIGVRSELVADHRLLATGRGGGPGDNRNAVGLATVLEGAVAGLQGQSLSSFYDSMVSRVGQGSAAESSLAEGSEAYLQSLRSQREQYSGVSLDEEAIKIMEFQRSFQSAARIISTVDELLGVLLNM